MSLLAQQGAMLRPRGGDPHWPNVSSLLHLDGANGSTNFTDQKGKVWSGANGAVITTLEQRFGTGSLNLGGGTTRKIETPSHVDFDFGTGDFTIEWWQYWISQSFPSYQAPFARGYNSPGALVVVTGDKDGRYQVFVDQNIPVAKEATTGPVSVWTHYAVTRNGTAVVVWRNGAVSASGTSGANIGISRKFAVGGYGSDSGAEGQRFNGYIDEFRVTKGVARYTSAFTPPDAPFPDS